MYTKIIKTQFFFAKNRDKNTQRKNNQTDIFSTVFLDVRKQ